MKVGILTFHNAINYGAVLQCYALKAFLAQRGHDVEVIDYRNPMLEEYDSIVPRHALTEANSFHGKLKIITKSILLNRKKKRIASVFNGFVRNFLNPSERYDAASDIPAIYDYIVFGSDQIWNPVLCGGFDDAFWGQFPKGKMKFVAYAASIGNPLLLSEEEWHEVDERIKAFDCISVRELQLKNIIEQRFSLSVSQCIDPTLLVDSDVLSKLALPTKLENYVFLYNVMNDDYSESFADFIAGKLGCSVVIGQAKPRAKSIRNNKKNILIDLASPEEFLGYIKNARVVIGNSFHAIAISIVFRKNFYSLDSKKPERITDLLGQLGLINRHVKATDRDISMESVNYEEIIKRLEDIRENSCRFISTCGL